MRFICVASAGLRSIVIPKILEYSGFDTIEPVSSGKWFFKSTALERISLIVRGRSSAVAVETQEIGTTADGDGVPPFVNVTLPDVTNYNRF